MVPFSSFVIMVKQLPMQTTQCRGVAMILVRKRREVCTWWGEGARECSIITRALAALDLCLPWTKNRDRASSPYNSETQGQISKVRALRGESSEGGRGEGAGQARCLGLCTLHAAPCHHERHAFCIKRKTKLKIVLLLGKTRTKGEK